MTGGATPTYPGRTGPRIRQQAQPHLDLLKDRGSGSDFSVVQRQQDIAPLGAPLFCHLGVMKIVSTWNGCWGNHKRWLNAQ